MNKTGFAKVLLPVTAAGILGLALVSSSGELQAGADQPETAAVTAPAAYTTSRSNPYTVHQVGTAEEVESLQTSVLGPTRTLVDPYSIYLVTSTEDAEAIQEWILFGSVIVMSSATDAVDLESLEPVRTFRQRFGQGLVHVYDWRE